MEAERFAERAAFRCLARTHASPDAGGTGSPPAFLAARQEVDMGRRFPGP
jgi:hypothetical protein